MGKQDVGLAAFHKERTGRKFQCWICDIPERGEIETALSNGVSLTSAAEWLIEVKGYEGATPSAMRSRMQRHRDHGGADG